ncbi:MAG: tyrosine--tRNA ligase [Alphaproteobacteria bacterium]|nr:tyrosine--tRNA ligase [Alphaproteobacteria bacterium]
MIEYTPKSRFLQTLSTRGFLHQVSNIATLDEKLCTGAPISAYIGFDATANSLHVGSLVQIMMLRILQQSGHRPLVLLGGGTTLLGDPSGKDEQRQLLSRTQIGENAEGIRAVLSRFLRFGDAPSDAVMLNNADWLCDLNMMDFLRGYGRLFSVNRMLSFDSVRLRLEREQPLSFLEFNYMVMQAYDYLNLHRSHDCLLQMGGSDQWGNIVNGIDLIRRTESAEAFAITTPLLTMASGAKMGKTAAGAVWLSADKLSCYDFWQFWRNTANADVGRFLRLFTDLPLEEIALLEVLQGAEINEAKRVLANAVTTICHSEDGARRAAQTAAETFAGGAGEELPRFNVDMVMLQSNGVGVIDVLREVGFVRSGGEARNKIQDGAVKLGEQTVCDVTYRIALADFGAETSVKLSLGRKKHALIVRG